MRKPCTDCPYNEKIHFKDQYGRRITWQNCMAGRDKYWPNVKIYLGYYERIANCVDYAEYLAWQREHRKYKMKKI